MDAKKIFGIFTLLLISLTALASFASAIDVSDAVSVSEVKVDGTELSTSETNRLDLERDDSFEIRVELEALDDAEDLELSAFISGYEYNDFSSISDSTHIFDVEEDVDYVKKLTLSLPDDVEEDDYRLRLLISNRDGEEMLLSYRIKIDVPRHQLSFEDVVLTPENRVKAGQALLATVFLENKGEKDEDDVRVRVSIPELGVSDIDYISEIESDDVEETEELFLRVPKCSEAGIYDVDVEAEYDNGHESISWTGSVEVLESDACEARAAAAVADDAQATEAGDAQVKDALEVLLLVLVVVLVVIGLVIGFAKLRE